MHLHHSGSKLPFPPPHTRCQSILDDGDDNEDGDDDDDDDYDAQNKPSNMEL